MVFVQPTSVLGLSFKIKQNKPIVSVPDKICGKKDDKLRLKLCQAQVKLKLKLGQVELI